MLGKKNDENERRPVKKVFVRVMELLDYGLILVPSSVLQNIYNLYNVVLGICLFC